MKRNKRISIFLCIILCINICLTNFSVVLAVEGGESGESGAAETAANFIDFYANGAGASLNMDNLTVNDYYTLYCFMSNWFKPGITTLYEVVNPDETTGFYQDFVTAMSKTGNTDLQSIIQVLGQDFIKNGLKANKCTLLDKSGKTLTGKSLMSQFAAVIDKSDDYKIKKNSDDGKIYFESKGNLAFDLTVPQVRAAFQTAFAYSPDLFISDKGLVKCTHFFIDAVGNVWGAIDDAISENYNPTVSTTQTVLTDDEESLKKIYLVLPACLNPAAFSPSVDKMENLRMPLLNFFVLSSLVRSDNIAVDTITDNYIPFFNILSSQTLKRVLNVICVDSITPYLLKTDSISEHKWSKESKKETFKSLLYNSDSLVINADIENQTGKPKFLSNTSVIFSINMRNIEFLTNINGDEALDMHESILGFFVKKDAISAYPDDVDSGLKFLEYMCSPTYLDMNQVSMNFYKQPSANMDTLKEYLISNEIENGITVSNNGTVANQNLSKLGLKGMSLFTSDEGFYDTDSNTLYLTAEQSIPSKLYNDVVGVGQGEKNLQTVTGLINGTLTPNNLESFNLLKNMVLNEETLSFERITELFKGVNSEIDLGYSNKKADLNFATAADAYSFMQNRIAVDSISFGIPIIKGQWILAGNNNVNSTFGALISLDEFKIRKPFSENLRTITIVNKNDLLDYITTIYAYKILFPSSALQFGYSESGKITVLNNTETYQCGMLKTDVAASSEYLMGMYLGYAVDMMGLSVCNTKDGLSFAGFTSKFLPSYSISAKGGTLSLEGYLESNISGVENGSDKTFENMQKELISRIYGITTDGSNGYRNSLIKNILEGFVLTVHRTVTGTWGSAISTVSTGSSNTYQSVTGYIYTPTLEELSFTSSIMNNYLNVYVICMIVIIFLLVLMVLLHLRTPTQGIFIVCVMFVALLFPSILISNSINISNTISDKIYSDRFDFWALSEHLKSVTSLKGSDAMTEKEKWLTNASATTDVTRLGEAGIKIKWMSPKKVDMFQTLYSDASVSQSFVTNMNIFKWLFATAVYDSEFVDTDVFGSYVYRSYNNIALEAQSYYNWGITLNTDTNSRIDFFGDNTTYNVTQNFDALLQKLGENKLMFLGAVSRLDEEILKQNPYSLAYSDDKLKDLKSVGPYVENEVADKIGTWGMRNSEIIELLNPNDSNRFTNTTNPGVYSNLPTESFSTHTFDDNIEGASKAIYLKNTESPYYYFYSVLKSRYGETGGISTNLNFRNALLEGNIFQIKEVPDILTTDRELKNAYRDYLDIEGLFEFVIPYLKLCNEYVAGWQKVNGSEIEQYNFDYSVNSETGEVDTDSIGKDDKGNVIVSTGKGFKRDNGVVDPEYTEAVKKKNNMNRIWNMYCPWVDAMYELDITEKVSVGGKKIYIEDTLNPSYYLKEGRPMIFSEADMIIKGYSYKDLTDVERRIQAVLEKTHKDLLYLINYYDMDDEVLLSAAAMYATFNFNTEFSQKSFLGKSVMLYPKGFELKNFNYDAYMRLALLNATGENVFGDDDLYERVLSKTNIFTGLLLIICDIVACIGIPMFKFIILVGLLFLGILVCLACVINPPEKIFESVCKSLILPTFLFMALNIGFAWVMSLIVGEGLTAYVGSKGVNFATNDPTITMLIMALLGIAYLFCAWKILKFLIAAYKQFGMGTALAAVGIVGAAIAGGTAGVAKKASRIAGGAVGAGIGAATAGKGNRLSGVMEGAGAGTKGIVGRRLNEKRMVKALSGGLSGNKQTTDKINDLASSSGSGPNTSGSNSEKSSSPTPPGKAPTKKEESQIPPSELDRDMNNVTDKKANKLGKALGGLSYTKAKVADKFDAVKSGFKKTGYIVSNLPDVARYGKDKASGKVTSKIDKASSYMGSALKTYRDENDFNKYRNSERSRERSERQQTFEQKVADKATIDRNIKMMNKKRQVG